jgi:hypothetical protein
MKPEQLINFGNLSRLLAGNRSSITRSRIPKKHRKTIQNLLTKVNENTNKNHF